MFNSHIRERDSCFSRKVLKRSPVLDFRGELLMLRSGANISDAEAQLDPCSKCRVGVEGVHFWDRGGPSCDRTIAGDAIQFDLFSSKLLLFSWGKMAPHKGRPQNSKETHLRVFSIPLPR
ncbi:hypothetical protein CEXT_159581 [Caerostris extrusa]|uniref:Uncharacterized protein n=1 Tax=Caerostris extrusa TaxID=172846 RepID=A0AAV4T0U2_CAEEX|nr:hypothetical protein CEXT_159581 [Caerostris extrusa]